MLYRHIPAEFQHCHYDKLKRLLKKQKSKIYTYIHKLNGITTLSYTKIYTTIQFNSVKLFPQFPVYELFFSTALFNPEQPASQSCTREIHSSKLSMITSYHETGFKKHFLFFSLECWDNILKQATNAPFRILTYSPRPNSTGLVVALIVFRRSRFQISALKETILTQYFMLFLSTSKEISKQYLKIRRDCYLSFSFQFPNY